MTIRRFSILGARVDAGPLEEMDRKILDLARSGATARVLFANVHMVVESWRDPVLRRAMEEADLVCPDGMPLVWLLRRWVPGQERVEGMSAFPRLMEAARREGVGIGWIGSTESVQESLRAKTSRELPGLRAVLSHAPPFQEPSASEQREHEDRIRQSGADLVFVGLGCPRQERWMAGIGNVDACLLGVGNAFEVWLGLRHRAPRWARRCGLEWLFRLAQEPRRLAGRYARSNILFLLALPAWCWKTRRFSI